MLRTAKPTILLVIALLGAAASAAAQDELGSLLARLSEGPADRSILYAIEGQRPDPRTLPALEAAFEKGATKEEKQLIAATLLRLGEGAQTYFGYLAGYAASAVDDRTPMFIKYDSKGQSISGYLDPAFEGWCAQNGKNPHEVARLLATVYPADVRILAYAQDLQAVALFKRGLESSNALVVAYSVQGLGRLNDSGSIPLIRKSCDRLPSGEKLAVAMQLPWFASSEAEQLMHDLAPDANMRDVLKRLVYQQQLLERNNALRRAGALPPEQAPGK
jgi:hypothetical protein